MHAHDNYLWTAFRALRDAIAVTVDIPADTDRRCCYDLIEELTARHAAATLRRVCGKKGKPANIEGDRSNFEGDRSKSEGDRGKTSRAGAVLVAVAIKS